MTREIKLSRLDTFLSELDYPLPRPAAEAAAEDVTLLLADGTEELDDVVAASSAETFDSMDELLTEIMGLLPQHAVGEPYQSEGEG